MVFNSPEFLIFFSIVFVLYLLLSYKHQNAMFLLASYIFYGYWDWRFLALMLVSTVLDYTCGIQIAKTDNQKRKKLFLIFSMVGNLGILAFFKYFNFFALNFERILDIFGWPHSPIFLNVILPIGISFYTFQSMSYTIDVYRGKAPVVTNFLDYANFVAFFPSLVAGPIERPANLMPQVDSPRPLTWENISRGSYLFLWGLFLKMYVADNLAPIVNPIFASPGPYHGAEVMLALYAFAFQIFCDFAGYSIMAQGVGKLIGFDIMDNFRHPYFTSNPRDFWAEWHISLSTWLRDYLYIPLGGNRKGELLTYRNLMITMLLGGLWHGAAWTFVFWGAYQGILLCSHRFILSLTERGYLPTFPQNSIWKIIKVILFFQLICLGWLLFRAQSMTQIGDMLYALIFNWQWESISAILPQAAKVIFFVSPLLVIQLIQRLKGDFDFVFRLPWALQGSYYFVIFFLITIFSAGAGQEFIYFQF